MMPGTHPLASLALFFLLVNANLNAANEVPDNQLHLNLQTSGDRLEINWELTSNITDFYGFIAVVTDEEDEILYKSPLVHISQRSMSVNQEITGKVTVCVRALFNDTQELMKTCETIESMDLKMIVGILAGAMFLVPCIIGLVYIIYKDKKIMQQQAYSRLQDDINSTKKQINDPSAIVIELEKNVLPSKSETTSSRKSNEVKRSHSENIDKTPRVGATNLAFVTDKETEDQKTPTQQQSTEAKLSIRKDPENTNNKSTTINTPFSENTKKPTLKSGTADINKVLESQDIGNSNRNAQKIDSSTKDLNNERPDKLTMADDRKTTANNKNDNEPCPSRVTTDTIKKRKDTVPSGNSTPSKDNKSLALSSEQPISDHLAPGDIEGTINSNDNPTELSGNFTSVRL